MRDLRTYPVRAYAPDVGRFAFAAAVGVIALGVLLFWAVFLEATPEPSPVVRSEQVVNPAPTASTLAEDCARMERVVGKPSFTGNPFFLMGIAEDPKLARILESPHAWASAPQVWRAVAKARLLCG